MTEERDRKPTSDAQPSRVAGDLNTGGVPESLPESEEPVVTGTLFMAIIFLMMVFGFWITMYIMLLDR